MTDQGIILENGELGIVDDGTVAIDDGVCTRCCGDDVFCSCCERNSSKECCKLPNGIVIEVTPNTSECSAAGGEPYQCAGDFPVTQGQDECDDLNANCRECVDPDTGRRTRGPVSYSNCKTYSCNEPAPADAVEIDCCGHEYITCGVVPNPLNPPAPSFALPPRPPINDFRQLEIDDNPTWFGNWTDFTEIIATLRTGFTAITRRGGLRSSASERIDYPFSMPGGQFLLTVLVRCRYDITGDPPFDGGISQITAFAQLSQAIAAFPAPLQYVTLCRTTKNLLISNAAGCGYPPELDIGGSLTVQVDSSMRQISLEPCLFGFSVGGQTAVVAPNSQTVTTRFFGTCVTEDRTTDPNPNCTYAFTPQDNPILCGSVFNMNDSGLFSFGLQTPIWDRRQIGPCKVDFTGTTFEVFQGAKGTAPEPFCSTGGYGSGGAAANAKPENPVSFIPVTE